MMMMLRVALIVIGGLLMVACGPTYQNKRHASQALLVFSTAATACDYGQTMPLAMQGWKEGREGNLLMGRTPSATTLTAYNAAVIAGNLALYKVVPEEYDWIVPLGLSLVEASVIQMNVLGHVPRPYCGVR